jgi:D-threo-aldose 1-dehydrogenase
MPIAPGALGYGCASLMARTTRVESVRLMEVAYDSGITHFDVARSYGYGRAESAVADFLHGRRDTVTVTTKVGILPPSPSRSLDALRTVARRVAPLSGRLRAAMRRRAVSLVTEGAFTPAAMRSSFETSLRELRTDHVDVLLLHDPSPGDLTTEALGFLAACRSEGTARAVGIAADRDLFDGLGAIPSAWGTVAQLPDSLMRPPRPPELAPHVITHSVMGHDTARLHAHLAGAGLLAAWSAAVDADLMAPDVFARHVLAGALRRNPRGTVLVGSRDPHHIRDNARVAADPPPGVAAFQDLVDGERERAAAALRA